MISGFALSIGYIEKGQRRVVFDMALRRYPRLVIPIFGGSLFTYLLMKSGLMHNQEAAAILGQSWISQHFAFEPKFLNLMRFATYKVFFNYSSVLSFDTPLWTMSVELFGSFLVFGILILCRNQLLRIFLSAAVIAYYWSDPVSCMPPFVLGVILADISKLIKYSKFRTSGASCSIGLIMVSGIIWYVYDYEGTVPSQHMYFCIATVIVASLVLSSRLASMFEKRLSAWLGKISFSLYLVHMPIITSFSCGLLLMLLAHGIALQPAMIVCFLLSLPVMLGAARLFYPIEHLGVVASQRFAQFALTRTTLLYRAAGSRRH